MLRPSAEVADQKERLDLPLIDPVFQHSRRHHVGFIRDLTRSSFVDFVESVLKRVWHFSLAKKAGAQRLNIGTRASDRHFLAPALGPLLAGDGLGLVEFGAPRIETPKFCLSLLPTLGSHFAAGECRYVFIHT